MNLYTLLGRRAEQNNPVKVALIGAGKFGSMFLAQARLIDGIKVVGVADLQMDRARSAMIKTGWPEESFVAVTGVNQINDAAAAGRVGLTEDCFELIKADTEVVIECTGIPEAGAKHALAAIESGRHVVMVTVEADSLVGPLLCERAARAGVVYSMAYGDQPALVCEMIDWARTCGFEVIAAGKGTKYLPEYRHSTPDTVWEHYGFTAEQITVGGFNAKMFNSFLDGTKSAIEMAAIANATGLVPQDEGLGFPAVGVDRLADVLKPRLAGGVLTRSPTVEVVSSLNRDGSPVAGDLRWGVYVTFKAPTEYVKDCFSQYGLTTDSSGFYTALYRPNHLIGLELNISVASAALRREPTGASNQFIADVGAAAKRDLETGDILDGEGGFTVMGKLVTASQSVSRRIFPMGLTSGARIRRPVGRDQLITYDDVEIGSRSTAWNLRQELEERYRSGVTLAKSCGNCSA